jgi:hypothetical protein
MNKKTRRILSLLLLFSLLVGVLPLTGVYRAAAAEPGTVATEEESEPPAVTETDPTEPMEKTPTETEPEDTDTPEDPTWEEDDSGEITDLDPENPGDEDAKDQEPQEDEVRAASYSLQIPMILYGTSTFSVSFKYPNDPNQTTYTVGLSGLRYHYLNGKMAYCLEPQAGSTAGAIYSQIAGGANLNVWDKFLNAAQRNAIALALAYGAPNRLNSSNSLTKHGYEAATQVIVWELIIGYRSSARPFTRANAGLYNFVLNLCNPNDSTGTLRAAYVSGYSTIVSAMQNHGDIPSFGSRRLATAPTHEMAYDSAAGVYKVVLTDTNNAINNDFPYTNGNGLTFSKSGNKLTVTATAAALQNAPVTVMSTGSNPDVEDASPVIWGTSASNHTQGQILCQMAEPDPVPCYFKLTAPTMTTLTIQKVCADGKIGGITFTVKDSAGNTLFTGQTDAEGKLNVPNLEIGATVTVTETVPEDYVCENRTQTVTLTAGTNTVTFRNVPLGTAAMNKVSDAGDVEGYCFNLYRAKAGNTGSKTWHGKSDADGRIYETDGSYNVLGTEKSYVFKGLTDGTYSFREVLSVYGAGNVWPESIAFSTSGGSTPACNLTFTGDQLIAQDNGDCTVSGINLTGLDGGGTLTITIKNELVIVPEGEISVRKVNQNSQPLSGVTFLLEYSTDGGTSWTAVTSRNESDPITTGACTSAGLNNGKLITGNDGLAVFAGLCVETDAGPILYRLTETATKPGYSLLVTSAYEGPLPEDEEYVVTLTVVNMPEYQLPMTGGKGLAISGAGVALALAAAAALLYLLRKKGKQRNYI